jgi:hypothetical protein
MQTLLPAELVLQRILHLAPQLGTTCREYRENLPSIDEAQKGNIKFPSVGNKNPIYIQNRNITFEYESKIDFKKLDELIEHHDVQELNISTDHRIFLEIKKMFEIILKMDRSVMNGWKYKNTFIQIEQDNYEFLRMDWIDSFVTNFIFYLYH